MHIVISRFLNWIVLYFSILINYVTSILSNLCRIGTSVKLLYQILDLDVGPRTFKGLLAIAVLKLAWTIDITAWKLTSEGANTWYLELTLAFKDSVLVGKCCFKISSVLVSVLERVNSIIITHLVLLPHAQIFIPVGKSHLALSGPLAVEQLALVDIAWIVLENANWADHASKSVWLGSCLDFQMKLLVLVWVPIYPAARWTKLGLGIRIDEVIH